MKVWILLATAAFSAIADESCAADRSPNHTYSLAEAASNWVLFIDTKSMSTENGGDYKTAWLLWVYDPPREIPESFARWAPGTTRYEEDWTEFLCGAQKFLAVDRFLRNDQNISVAGGAAVPEEPFHPIEEDKLNWIAFGLACGKLPPTRGPALTVDQAVSEARSLMAKRK